MKYNPALDGIRAVAILMVMCFHAMVPMFWGGYLGVDVFFVLSGFLITSLLLGETDRTGSIDLGQFYKRRLARLTPPLVAMLITYLLLARLAWPMVSMRTDFRDTLIALFYFSDYANAFWSFPENLRHTWSLSVEEHFYLLWPAVILLLLKLNTPKQRLGVLAAMYVGFSLWRIAWELHGGHSYTQTYYRFDTRLSGLTLGALFAFLFHYRLEDKLDHLASRFTLLPFLILPLCSRAFNLESNAAMIVGIPLVQAATLLLIHASLRRQQGLCFRLLSNPIATYIGRMSYGLYLWHYPIFRYMWGRFDWYETLFGGGAIALLLATLSYYTIERIVRRARARKQEHLALSAT